MIEQVSKDHYDEYDTFLENHVRAHFAQSSIWGAHKSDWDFEAILCREEDGNIKGSLGVLLRRLPGTPFKLMYGCRGPICDADDLETLSELLEGAAALAKKRGCYLLKLDPDIKAGEKGFHDTLISHGYELCGHGKNFEAIQPKFVFRLDIKGKTEDEVFNAFESKTRYNIRLATRRGVEVRVCGAEYLEEFSRLMEDTGERDGFEIRNEDYFLSMLENLGDKVRLYMAFYEGRAIAGTLAISFGNKVWYLYGASGNEHRNVMPNYLLQWEMIKWAIKSGCDIYDFRGVSGDLSPENPLYGLYRFKKGFNGELTEFLGEYERCFKPTVRALTNTAIKTRRALYGLKRKMKKGRG